MLLSSKRLDLDDINILIINDSIFYRVLNVNRDNEFYIEVRDIIINNLFKYKDIIFSKCAIYNGVLFYLNRL